MIGKMTNMDDPLAEYTPQELLDDIERYGANLSHWETIFVDDMVHKLTHDESLSEGMVRKLKQIHTERVG